MRGGFAALSTGIDRLTTLLRVLAQIALAVMMLTICYDAVMRYAFSAPTLWSLELNTILVLFITVIPAGEVLRSGMQLRVNFFTERMGKGVQKVLEIVAAFAGVLFCGFMTWKGLAMAMHALRYGERMSTAIGTPFVVPYILIPVGFGVMCLQYALQLVRTFAGAQDASALAYAGTLETDPTNGNYCKNPDQVL